MNNKHTKAELLSSLFWKFMERGGTQGIQFVIQIILARLLTPNEYGVVAIISVFIVLSNVFIQSGLNMSLIQKKNADETDFSSVFFLSLLIATFFYIVLFFSAPFIASYYNNQDLTLILRVLSIILFFGAVNSVQNAIIARKMLFKNLFYSSLWANLISGIIGIVYAYYNFGVWALVAQQISNHFLIMVILWKRLKWRPILSFSFSRIKILFSFGWKILVSSLLNTFYMNLRTLIIGSTFSADLLGYYNRGQQFPQIIVDNINGSIQSVMLPALSSNQDNLKKIKVMVKRTIMTSSYLIFPLMIGLAVIAEPLIITLLSDKWLPTVPFLQIYCCIYALKPISQANLQSINALGRSDIFLKLETISTIFGVILLIISIPFGVLGIALGALISGILSAIIYMKPNSILIDYSFMEQIKDILPSFIIASIMGIVVYPIKYLEINTISIIILQVVLGIIIYIFLSRLIKIESFLFLREIVEGFIKSKHKE